MGKLPTDDQKPDPDRAKTDRRGFLKLAGLGSVVGGAALVAGTSANAAQPAKAGRGYRETKHVRTYYDTARF